MSTSFTQITVLETFLCLPTISMVIAVNYTLLILLGYIFYFVCIVSESFVFPLSQLYIFLLSYTEILHIFMNFLLLPRRKNITEIN